MTIAQKLNDKRISIQEVVESGGEWDDTYAVYVFPDNSFGGFTDIKNGASERTPGGEYILRFVAGEGFVETD